MSAPVDVEAIRKRWAKATRFVSMVRSDDDGGEITYACAGLPDLAQITPGDNVLTCT